MTLHEVKNILDANFLCGDDQLDIPITSAFGADVMSDLLAFGKAGSLLLTRMTSPQVIRTSDILDIAAIVITQGNVPSADVIQLAEELNIPLLTTRYLLFEAAGRLYGKGLRGRIEKVDERPFTA